ncbi:TIGR04084 family radical SAM/SPASM domain-containing protein [Candidatus Bathyarchaeota archaeon]|nr:TIGR04084 family radical SAM/SPASM domain-containing protein [Candidatus Bathyarchaeota archaeon]
MFFHVILTTECNLQCRYCYGEALEDMDTDFLGFDVEYSLPKKISYDIDLLDKFCSQDPDCALTFYGGEPLLCIEEIKQIMDCVRAKYFMIQTNGLFLKKLEPEYVNRFHTILVSLDGDEVLTDFYRGKGCFKEVMENVKWIRQRGFGGELIARMTVMENTDIHKQVKWLVTNSEFPFSSVHWQLNAGFWGNDFARRDFKRWSEESYNPGIRKLARFWVDYMEENGAVLRLYPFLGIAESLLSGKESSLLRCGGGWTNYAIQTDGYIVPCPTMWGMKDYYVGHISKTCPLGLKKIFVSDPCTKCDAYSICGGRCLYANVTKRWNTEAYSLVCSTVKNLINAVESEVPRIRRLIENGKVSINDFQFMKYNGCEIIP